METAVIDVPEEFSGVVIEKLSQRKGELRNMSMSGSGSTRLEFSILTDNHAGIYFFTGTYK